MALTQVFSVITSDAVVAGIMSSRLYPMRMPQDGALPAAVFQLIATEPINSIQGDSGLDLLRIQIKAWATKYTDAHNLALAIRDALVSAASLKILTEFVADDQDEETHHFCVIMQFSAWSEFDVNAANPAALSMPYEFQGDGVTTQFLFPSIFRAGSLLLFRNGILEQKTVDYSELPGRTGVSFSVAPAGSPNPDKFAAYYE